MTPLPEIHVNPKTGAAPELSLRFFDAIQESIGARVESMIQTQMQAYPSCWPASDRREMAELYFSKGGVK